MPDFQGKKGGSLGQTGMVGHPRKGITTTLLKENLSFGVAASGFRGVRCGGRGKQGAPTPRESRVMVPELLLPPWAGGGGREEEEEGLGLTAITGAPMDRDGIQRDVQVSRAAPHSFKHHLWETGGDHSPCKLLCLGLPVSLPEFRRPSPVPLLALAPPAQPPPHTHPDSPLGLKPLPLASPGWGGQAP